MLIKYQRAISHHSIDEVIMNSKPDSDFNHTSDNTKRIVYFFAWKRNSKA